MRAYLGMLSAVAALGAVWAFPAFAEPAATPQPVEGRTATVIKDGRTYLVSKTAATTVVMMPMPNLTQEGRLAFLLVVTNNTAAPIEVTEQSVSAEEAGVPVALITREQLATKARSRSASRQFEQMRAMQALGDARGSGATVRLPQGPGATPPGRVGFQSSNPRMANSEAAVARNEAAASGATSPASSDDPAMLSVFKPLSVGPGQAANTFLNFAKLPRNEGTLAVKVLVGAETHELTFAVVPK